ncbi:MAG: chemotaxis protein CheB, partial [Ferruginibacter sp.]
MSNASQSTDQTEYSEKELEQKYIVAIGASAGGLEALQDFLTNFPTELPYTAIVIAQHLSPTHKSMLVQLLSRTTTLSVKEAKDGQKLISNTIYITPPDKEITIVDHTIRLIKPHVQLGPKPSVDVLFHSLSNEPISTQIIAVILSGTGSDGASGVSAIHKCGGFVIVQEPSSAKYDGMPQSAIETDCTDLIIPPSEMGKAIQDFILQPKALRDSIKKKELEGTSLQKIFTLLSRRTGTDFSNYKSATIFRRLEKRLAQLKINSLETYIEFLERKPSEIDEMFQMILIGVTTFFRDNSAFESLNTQLSLLIKKKSHKEAIRIWVPGCSTGEEPYTIAIILNELLKERLSEYNIQIFATDIDDTAISIARKGIYPAHSLRETPAEIKDRYFLRKGDDFELIKPIRSLVLFSKHDLTNNPPFLKLDVISCRNLLIYFGTSLQHQVFPIFHYALNTEGILLLGKSESVGQFTDLFSIVDAKNKLFQKKRGNHLHAVKFSAFKAQRISTLASTKSIVKNTKSEVTVAALIKETLFNSFPHPYVVINENLDIEEVYGDIRLFVTLSTGEMQANLIKMVNPELQIELRSVLTNCIKARQTISSKIRKFTLFNQVNFVKITAQPLIYNEQLPFLYIVIFEKLELDETNLTITEHNEGDNNDAKIRELEQELIATKEHLQTYIEEIETSNEELQSLNEELQSTNEELQSSNEELETSNEELQSTNEEVQIAYAQLKAANDELEHKEKQLKEWQYNHEALLNNSLQAFLLINNDYKILAFNDAANEVANLIHGKTLKIGDNLINFCAPNNIDAVITEIKLAFEGNVISGKRKEITQTLQPAWFEYNFTPVLDHYNKVHVVSYG